MLDKFLNNGFIKINDPKAFKFFDIDSVEWTEKGSEGLAIIKRNQKIENQLDKTREYVSDKHIMPIFGSHAYSKIEVVDGLDLATLVWHNDLVEGPNCGCLMYCDDTDEETGGAIMFRHARSKEEIIKYYPKKYDILIVNHSLRFQHMVTEQKMPVPRRVISLNFNIDERKTK